MDMAVNMSWMDVLIQVIKIVLGLVVAYGIPQLASVVKRYVKNDKAIEYLERAQEYLTDAVVMVNQTFVESLKKEGKFDAEAQKAAFKMAADAWLAMMNEEMKKVVLAEVGDLETYIKTKIEAEVNVQKSAA